jgi:hypothetical protein
VRVSSTPDGVIRAVGKWGARFVFSDALKQQLERLVGAILRASSEQQSPSSIPMACPELRHTFSVLREPGHSGGVQCVLEGDKLENIFRRKGRQMTL